MSCTNPDHDLFPMYGVAPHECYWRKPGGFEKNPLGTSTILNLDQWPDDFLAEIDPGKAIAPQVSWGLCGVHYCPTCKGGMAETASLWGPKRIQAAIADERAKEGGQ